MCTNYWPPLKKTKAMRNQWNIKAMITTSHHQYLLVLCHIIESHNSDSHILQKNRLLFILSLYFRCALWSWTSEDPHSSTVSSRRPAGPAAAQHPACQSLSQTHDTAASSNSLKASIRHPTTATTIFPQTFCSGPTNSPAAANLQPASP